MIAPNEDVGKGFAVAFTVAQARGRRNPRSRVR
jgi:hypothetical protein